MSRMILSATAVLVLLVSVGPLAHAQTQAAPVSVDTARPLSGTPSLALTGSLRAPRRSLLSPTVAGRVDAVLVDLGDRVTTGQALVQLDAALAERALASLQAQLRQAEATLDEARRLAQEGRAVGPAGGLSDSVIASREAAARVAEAAQAAQQQQVAQQAEILRRHTVRAPYDGVIVARQIEAGEWAATGTTLLELLDQSRLQLDVLLPQQHAGRVQVGQAVVVRPDTAPDTVLEGTIRAVVPAAEAASRALRLRVDVDPGDSGVLPGMSATAGLRFDSDRAVQIARDAILRRPDSSTGVWVVNGTDGALTVSARRIRLGRRLGDQVEVLDGLREGERVVTHGNEGLSDGQAVRLVSPLGKARP